MTKKLSVILSLLFTLLHVNASNMLFHNDVNINWNNFYNIKLPFDANVVNTIFQDSNKLIWIGTKRGLSIIMAITIISAIMERICLIIIQYKLLLNLAIICL